MVVRPRPQATARLVGVVCPNPDSDIRSVRDYAGDPFVEKLPHLCFLVDCPDVNLFANSCQLADKALGGDGNPQVTGGGLDRVDAVKHSPKSARRAERRPHKPWDEVFSRRAGGDSGQFTGRPCSGRIVKRCHQYSLLSVHLLDYVNECRDDIGCFEVNVESGLGECFQQLNECRKTDTPAQVNVGQLAGGEITHNARPPSDSVKVRVVGDDDLTITAHVNICFQNVCAS